MEYMVFFNIKPMKYTRGLKSVLHLTLDKDFGAYGDRNPGVWFHEDGSGKLSIFAALNGDANYYIETPPLKLLEWSSVKISQIYQQNKFWLFVDLNGVNIYKAENFDPRDFSNIKVYASDPWYNAQQGSINDLLIINGKMDKLSIVIGVTVPLFVLLVITTAVMVKVHRKKKLHHGKSTWMMNYMDNDLKDFNSLSKDEWEIFPGSIMLEKKIGEGAFGTVFIGKVNPEVFAKSKNPKQKSFSSLHFNNEVVTNVAVKLLKDGANQSEFDDFREEINLMKEIRYHKNIVNMIGCSTIKKPLCLIVEFMENGDLLNFLRNRRTKLFTSKVDKESANTFMYTESYQKTLETKKCEDSTPEYVSNDIRVDEVELLSPDDLLSFAWQVASGMEFLSYNKLVHRDLAARNILVGNEKNIKISDFGLTRKTNDELNYMGNKNRRLPVKWMSVEAIFDQIFTSCSDVWAYGVVLFEIVTLGGTPYPSISNRELLALLKTGYRMDRPENCSELMYDMMLHCWNEDPLQRPTFTELREHLDEIISQGDSYFSFDLNEQSIYYNAASFNSLPSETADNALDKDILERPAHVKSIEEIKKPAQLKSIEEINKDYNDPVAPSNELCLNGETFNRQTELSLPIGLINNAFNESLSEI